MIDENACYSLRTDAAFEPFNDGALVFRAADISLLNLNSAALSVLERLDGKTTLREIATAVATDHHGKDAPAVEDVIEIIADLEKKRVVKPRVTLPVCKGATIMDKNAKYLCNPDTSCRIEDDDGAILYCADTFATQIINPIGLELWETLSTPHTQQELVAHLRDVCESVPQDDVEKDVERFLTDLLRGGFIGQVEESTDA